MADDKKKEIDGTDDKIAKAISKALEDALPMAVMAAAQILKPAERKVVTQEDVAASRAECSTCGLRRIACHDEHELMYVGPRNHRYLKDFPGVYINGVWFKSAAPGHRIPVPKKNGIAFMIQQWENSEDDNKDGRTIDWNSGTLSGSGKNSQIRTPEFPGFTKL
jgi:hypothetical protein